MDTETMIRELESVEEKHKDDTVYTGQLNIAEMAHDVRKRLEELNIRKHMNDGWIPVEKRLPEKFSIGVEVTTKDLERNLARYAKPPMDMWISVYTGRTLDVIAWKEPSESYHPEGLETRKNSKGARKNE